MSRRRNLLLEFYTGKSCNAIFYVYWRLNEYRTSVLESSMRTIPTAFLRETNSHLEALMFSHLWRRWPWLSSVKGCGAVVTFRPLGISSPGIKACHECKMEWVYGYLLESNVLKATRICLGTIATNLVGMLLPSSSESFLLFIQPKPTHDTSPHELVLSPVCSNFGPRDFITYWKCLGQQKIPLQKTPNSCS